MKKNEIVYIVIAVAAVVIVAGGVYWFSQSQGNNLISYYLGTQNTNVTNVDSATQNNNITSGKLSYSDAVKLYGDNRIQFDSKCLLTPNNATFKVGTKVMFDNRSGKVLKVVLDGVAYNLSLDGYMVITLNTNSTLPHSIVVDCNAGQNNGTILLQK